MKSINIFTILIVFFILVSCSHIDKNGFKIYENDNKKAYITEKNGGIMLKFEIEF